jgi:acetyl esterase/lipase
MVGPGQVLSTAPPYALGRGPYLVLKHSRKNPVLAAALAGWAVVALLSGVLTLVRAPSILSLKLKVVVTEYGYVLAALYAASVPLARLAGFSGRARAAWTTGILAGAALTAAPAVRAATFAKGLPPLLETAFGGPAGRGRPAAEPFHFRRLARPWPRSRAGVERVVFAETPGYRLEFDLYRPDRRGAGGAPCVVVVHGGKWTEGDSAEFSALNSYLARRGYTVVGINYRKAGRYPFPAARDDLRAAVEYVKRHAEPLGIDPERIALLGRSAGGQLALLVAYERRDPAVRAVVSFYAPTDLRYGYRDPTNPWVIDHEAALEVYLGGDPESAGEAYDAASPIRFVSLGCPPTLLLHGAHDELVHAVQGDRLAARLREVGAPHLYLRLPWATHGFDHNLVGPGGQISTYAVERFLERVLDT